MKTLPIVALAVTLTACASNDVVDQTYVDVAKVEKATTQVPEWYLSVPNNDETIYSAGTAVAPDVQFAVDIATLNAKVQLADRVESRLSGQIKQYEETVGENLIKDTSKTIRNVIVEADVAGYTRDKMVIYPEGTQYRVYTLLAYNEDEAFKVLTYRLKAKSDTRVKDAFEELDQVVAATTGTDASVVSNDSPVE